MTRQIALAANGLKTSCSPLELMPGENRNLFVTTTATAEALGLARISDLAR